MTIHDQLVEQFEIYMAESARFEAKGIKASAAREETLSPKAEICRATAITAIKTSVRKVFAWNIIPYFFCR